MNSKLVDNKRILNEISCTISEKILLLCRVKILSVVSLNLLTFKYSLKFVDGLVNKEELLKSVSSSSKIKVLM